MILSFNDENRWLSNFEPVEIILEGIHYPSSEHAYASAKSDSMEWKSFCATHTNTAGKVKREGRKQSIVPNWDDIKVSIMKDCIQQKFAQEPYKTKLLNTGNQWIEEGNTWNDDFWGVDIETRQGLNILGHLIMEFRDDLRDEN